ncbi:MAG: CaiB/BaiF CoA transferase family protein [Candidatus Binataceae bacterium]
MANPPRMLEGYRVLDFSHFVAGPTCSRILAEMGAEVIKVERGTAGDHVRQFGVIAGGMSTYYFQHNHSKLGIALDLRKPRARELIEAMAPKIDVVVENFAPGVIAEMGFGYERMKALNPGIVMVSISAAGQNGALSRIPGYDYVGQAYAGVTELLGEPDRPPVTPGIAIGDVSTGVAAAMAVGFALLNRTRNGEGQHIDASLLDTYFHMHELSVPVVSLRPGRYQPKRTGALHPSMSPCGVFRAGGGYIFLIVQQHEMPRLWRAMGDPPEKDDPRFGQFRERLKNNAAIREMVQNWLDTFPDRDSALRTLEANRVPCAPVLKLEEAMVHPHMRERRTVRRVKDRAIGEFDLPGMPVKFSTWPERTELRAPRVGEDNERVMRELLGLGDAEIQRLYAENVLLRGIGPESNQNAAAR